MPIFELDEGRVRLVQPMQPLPGSFATDCAALLSEHLGAIAGEPLFPVRHRSGAPEHADLPELLALDATGRVVVVETVQVLDDDAVVAALRHAGGAGRMTATDLARSYHADPDRFAVDFAAFRDQVAFGMTTSRREGVRLVILCSEVATQAADTLGYLRGPGRHVDILQIGVVRGVDDRRMLEVSPLARHETVRRPVEPTALRLVRSSEASFATAMAYEGERRRPPVPHGPAGSGQTGTGQAGAGQPGPGTTIAPGLPAASAFPGATNPRPPAPAPHQQNPAPRHPTTHQVPAVPPPPPAAPAARAPGAPPPGAPAPGAPAPAAPYVPVVHPTSAPSRTTSTEPTPEVPEQRHAPRDLPYPELGTLAKQRRALVTLVWLRERRGQRVVATLRHDGLIELPDGRTFVEPGEAAAAAVDSSTEVDGWRSWRVGDGGPTLAQATGRDGFHPQP